MEVLGASPLLVDPASAGGPGAAGAAFGALLALACAAAAASAAWHARQGAALERQAPAPPPELFPAERSQRRPSWERVAATARCGTGQFVGGSPRGAAGGPGHAAAAVTTGDSSFWGTVLNIVTGGLGSGILCLPWAAAGATLAPAVAVVGTVLAVNAWTVSILVEAAERNQVFDIGGILACLPGSMSSRLQAFSNVTIWVSMFLCLVGYLVVMFDCAEKALHRDLEAAGWRPCVLVAAGALVVPLCFLDPGRLAFGSALTIAVNVFIFCLIASDAAGKRWGPADPTLPCILRVGSGTVAMVSTMMQCVIIQMCVLPMYHDLRGRSPRKFSHVIGVSFSVLFLLFTAFSVAGSVAYGPAVRSNVLKNLPEGAPGTIAQALMVLAIAAVYPIMLMPMVAPIKTSASLARYQKPITVAIGVCSVVVACFVDDLGALNVVNGCLCVGVFVGVIPAVVGVFFADQTRAVMTALATGCTLLGVLGFFFTDNYPPCDIDKRHADAWVVVQCWCTISSR